MKVSAKVAAMSGTMEKSVSNIFWAFLSFGGTKVLNLVAIIVLARLLSPPEIGLMAFCLVIMAYFEILSRFGLGAALISARADETEVAETADAVFALSLVFSSLMAVAAYALADTMAGFFDQPDLAPMLKVLCVAMVIESLGTVNNALMQKSLRFKQKLVPDTARSVMKGVVSIGLALAGFGVWSLVWGYLAGAVAFCVALWIMQKWRPRALPRAAICRRILRYGIALIGAETVNSLNHYLPMLLIGKMLGTGPLGIFSLAYRIPELAIRSFSLVASTVTHPIMAEMRDDNESLRRYFYGCLRYFSVLTFSGGAAIAVMTPALVVILYTPVWYDMIAPMQLLAIAFALATVNILPGAIYKAISRTDVMLRVSLINLPVTVVAFFTAVPYGLTAVAATEIGVVILSFLPNLYFLRRAIGIDLLHCAACVVPGVVCACVTVVAGSLGYLLFDTPMAQLATSLAAMLLSFAAALAVMAPEMLRVVVSTVRPKSGRPA